MIEGDIAMKNMMHSIVVVLTMLLLLSCTPSAPYEIRSPCVSVDHPYGHNPCPTRPANIKNALV